MFNLLRFFECLHFESLACFLWCKRSGRSQPSRLLPSPTFCVPTSPRHEPPCPRDRTQANVVVAI